MNRDEFLPIINGLAEIYNENLSDVKLDMYFGCLEGYTADQFKRAVFGVLKSRVYPSMPKPSEIIEQIDGKIQDHALLAWEAVIKAIRHHGWYKSVCFEDRIINGVISAMGGWEQLNEMLIAEEPFRKREFVDLYKALLRSGRTFPTKLIGYFERMNGAVDTVALIDCDWVPPHTRGPREIANESAPEMQDLVKKAMPTVSK